MAENVLEIRHLITRFPSDSGDAFPVNDVSFDVPPRSIVGLVGESGCGKSMTARSIMRIVKAPGRIESGSILFEGRELTTLPEREMNALRGNRLSMIFQEPMTSLNPVMRVGRQIEEVLTLHEHISRHASHARVIEIMEKVGLSDAEGRYRSYPHELSGGQRQRVMIAMAMICRPALLIADEPTTALDVTVAAQILELMKKLRDDVGTSILFISHDLGVVSELCDRVHVMYAGRIVESAESRDLFETPRHPYSLGLLRSVCSLEERPERLDTISGGVPTLSRLPRGCSFAPRCTRACESCRERVPELTDIGEGHFVRCSEVMRDE